MSEWQRERQGDCDIARSRQSPAWLIDALGPDAFAGA